MGFKLSKIVMIVFLGLLMCSGTVLAQQASGGGGSQAAGKQQGRNRGLDKLYRVIEDKNKNGVTTLNRNNDVEGSPYFTDEFVRGSVYFNNGLMGTSYLRYDAYEDEIQIKKTNLKEEEYGALLKNSELHCIIDSKKFFYGSYANSNGDLKKGYFSNLVNSGRYQLYIRKVKLFQKGKDAPTSLTASIPSKFIDQIGYYFTVGTSDKMKKVVKSKKKLIQLFEKEDRAEIKSFIRKKGIDLREKNDLLTLFYYANTL